MPLGTAVPRGVRSAGLWDDAGADGALGEVLDDVGGDADIIVKPAGFFEEVDAGLRWSFALRVYCVEKYEAAIAGELSGFVSCGLGPTCTRAGSASV
jgi:hypothetical protein